MTSMSSQREALLPRADLLFALLRAELRHFWWLQLAVLAAGLGVWTLLVAVTSRVSTEAQPEGVTFNYMASLLLSISPVLLVSSGVAGGTVKSRDEIWGALPVGRVAMNLIRLLSFVVLLWPAMLTWPLIIALLFAAYGPTSPWALVNASLLAAVGLLLSLRTRFAAVLVYLALPAQVFCLYFIPGADEFGRRWAEVNTSFYTSIAFTVLMLVMLRWILRGPALH